MNSNINAWGQFSRMTWKSEVRRRLELFYSIITLNLLIHHSAATNVRELLANTSLIYTA